jgi:hypothetical protein
MPKYPRHSPNPPGAPDPGANRTTHGIVAFKNTVKRRKRNGHDVIDRRSKSGQNAVAMRDQLIEERGGTDSLSVAQLAIIELIARDVYFVDEIDRRIFDAIYKLNQLQKIGGNGRIKNPKAIAMLYGYRSAVARNLATNLTVIGLQKPPPKVKTLDEILSEDEQP